MKEKNDLVSVIVPVYNVIKYLNQCIESILNQTYKFIEIILIDDGSTDGSSELCDEFRSRDPRIVVVHQVNKGLGAARNCGLKKSTGKYIAFVDSDDFISPYFIQELHKAIINTKSKLVAIPRGRSFFDGDTVQLCDSIVPVIKYLDEQEAQRQIFLHKCEPGTQWRLYSKELFNNFIFPENIYYEDLASTYKLIKKGCGMVLIDNIDLYAYRVRKNSILGEKISEKKIKSAQIVVEILQSDAKNLYPELSHEIAVSCFSLIRALYAQLPKNDTKHRELFWSYLKRYRNETMLCSGARLRDRLIACVSYIGNFGFYTICTTLREMHLMR